MIQEYINLFVKIAEVALPLSFTFSIGSYIVRKLLDLAFGRSFRL